MHSRDDQIVPYAAAGPKSADLLQNGTLITYDDLPHGMPTTPRRHHQRRPSEVPKSLTSQPI